MALDVDLGLQGLLVRRTDARELGDLALASLLVQALGVALLGLLDRDVDPDLDEGNAGLAAGSLGLVQLTCQVAVRSVGRDEAGDGDSGAVGEELGDLGDAADVLLAVLGAEAKVLVEAEADVVAVETVGVQVDRFTKKRLFERDGNGGLARGGEAGEPDGQAGLTAEGRTDGGGDGGGVVGDVAGHTTGLV